METTEMFTHNYKGMYIHGYADKDECTVSGFSIPVGKVFKSYRAAQMAVSKAVKAHDAAMMQAAKDGLL
jgi:hypothetical protein